MPHLIIGHRFATVTACALVLSALPVATMAFTPPPPRQPALLCFRLVAEPPAEPTSKPAASTTVEPNPSAAPPPDGRLKVSGCPDRVALFELGGPAHIAAGRSPTCAPSLTHRSKKPSSL